jgi:hypothetical protein
VSTVTLDLAAMFERLDRAHRAAAADTLDDVVRNQVKRTGKLAASFHTVEHVTPRGGGRELKIYIVSDAIYADAVERGANTLRKASVKEGTKARGIYELVNGKRKRTGFMAGPLRNRASRRGPHMKGNHVVLEHGGAFLEHMSYRIRET